MAAKRPSPPLVIGSLPSRVKSLQEYGQAPDVEEWLESGVWVEVQSTNVKAIAYDAQERTLAVRFDGKGKRDPEYHYQGVPEDVARDFFLASSMGVYLDQRIKKAGYSFRGPL